MKNITAFLKHNATKMIALLLMCCAIGTGVAMLSIDSIEWITKYRVLMWMFAALTSCILVLTALVFGTWLTRSLRTRMFIIGIYILAFIGSGMPALTYFKASYQQASPAEQHADGSPEVVPDGTGAGIELRFGVDAVVAVFAIIGIVTLLMAFPDGPPSPSNRSVDSPDGRPKSS